MSDLNRPDEEQTDLDDIEPGEERLADQVGTERHAEDDEPAPGIGRTPPPPD